MKRDDSSPSAYCDSVDGDKRKVLDAVRGVLRDQYPEVPESIRYGMLDYPGLCNVGAQKHHVAVYLLPESLARHQDKFPGSNCGKSCLRLKHIGQFNEKAFRELLADVRHTRAASGG